MSYKLSITDRTNNINCNVRYENLAKNNKPSIEAKATNGKVVRERTTYQGKVLPPGSTNKQWVDDDGNVYAKQELKFYCDGQEVSEMQQTKVFEVAGYQPLSNYTDSYVISKYYELSPCDNGMKKDYDRQVARNANLSQMHRLWQYLHDNNVVARGEFITGNKGFVASDGYIRAIQIDGKWTLEVGIFKEEKIFQHLNEGVPAQVTIPAKTQRKLKMV